MGCGDGPIVRDVWGEGEVDGGKVYGIGFVKVWRGGAEEDFALVVGADWEFE